MLRSKCFFLLLSGLLLFVLPAVDLRLWAEGTGQQKTPRKVCVFLNVDLSVSEKNIRYQAIITDLLKVEFENAGYTVIPEESWLEMQKERGLSHKDLVLGPNAVSLAAELEADLAVTGFYRTEGRRILLEIKCYDVAQKKLLAGVLRTGRLSLTVYNLITASVARVLPEIQLDRKETEVVQALQEPQVLLVQEATLISEDEDMEVYLAGDQFAGRIEQGKLSLMPRPFKVGTELLIEKRKAGYHSGWEVVQLEQEKQVVTLKPLKKKTRWATVMSLTAGQLLGFGLGGRCYIDPDYSFLSAEHYFYIQHSFLEGSRPVFHHDLKFLFGRYLFGRPGSRFRLGLSTGLGLILTYYSLPDMPLHTDFYLNVINLWLELSIGPWLIYFREEGKYGLGLGNNLLGRRWLLLRDRFPPMTIGVLRKW